MKVTTTIPGILGGGQLARMLCEAAATLGIQPGILTEHRSDPAAQLCRGPLRLGGLKDVQTLRDFFALVGPVAIESEFVNCDAIAAAGGASLVFPPLSCVRIVQNKLRQKLLLERIEVPTSRLTQKPPGESYQSWLPKVFSENNGPSGSAKKGVVLKWAEMGYDGKGTMIQGNHWDQREFVRNAIPFCEAAEKAGIDVYAEEKVPFVHEVALVAVRNHQGEFASYPLVFSEQTQGICKWVKGPAVALGAAEGLEAQALSHAKKIGDAVGMIGTFAVEYFVTPDNSLLVNEIAPRVHNTGHFTQDAAATSQFENHWRALLGLPLGPTTCKPFFAMVNLLGPEGVVCPDGELTRPQNQSDKITRHWYFKQELRPARKLGHLNTWATTITQLKENIAAMESIDREWRERLTRDHK